MRKNIIFSVCFSTILLLLGSCVKKELNIPVVGVSLDSREYLMTVGDTTSLVATVSPYNATNQYVMWSTSDGSVVRVKDGHLTAVSAGTATITVKTDDGGFSDACKVVVKPQVIPVTGVELDTKQYTLSEGDTVRLNAIISPSDASNTGIVWTSSNGSVAKVKDGLVTALKSGSTTIKAKTDDGGFSDSCEITVCPIAVPVTGINIDKSQLSIAKGGTALLKASVLPTNASIQTINWTSHNSSVVTVSKSGELKAVAVGNAVIVASSSDGGYTATCNVTVTNAAASVSLNKKTLQLKEYQAEYLSATVTPFDATNKNLSWRSTDENVVKVFQGGAVTAVKAGSAKVIVTLTETGASDTCSVSVICNVLGVKLDYPTLTLEEGDSHTLVSSVYPSRATDASVVWSSSDENVAKVSQTGVVSAIAPGTAVITVKTNDGNHTASCTVTVKCSANNIVLNKSEIFLYIDKTEQLEAQVTPEDASLSALQWESVNPDIATVSDKGLVTAIKPGKTTVCVSASDRNGKVIVRHCQVTVYKPIESITLNLHEMSNFEGSSFQLEATVLPEDAPEKGVTWISEDTSVATVDQNGLVNFVSKGVTNICATTIVGGLTDKCKVTVWRHVRLVTLNQTATTVNVGNTCQLTCTITPEDADFKEVTWSSSDDNVATVSQDGLVTAKEGGNAIITVKTKEGGYTATCNVTVYSPVTGVTVIPQTLKLAPDERHQLECEIQPQKATVESIAWKSSDQNVVMVNSETGYVIAVGLGEADVTVTVNGTFTSSCHITVEKIVPVTSVSFAAHPSSVLIDETLQMSASVLPQDATNKHLVWTSSIPSIASVDQNGLITAHAKGTTEIKAEAQDGSGKFDSFVLTVSDGTVPVSSVSISSSSSTLIVKKNLQLSVTVLPEDATDKTVQWTSSIPGVATVDPHTGLVTGVSEGKTQITAQAQDGSGESDTFELTVTNEPVIPITSITLSKTKTTMELGKTETLTKTVLPDNTTDTVEWSSDDEDIATVNEGVITPVAVGNTVIYATSKSNPSVYATCSVTVVAKIVPVERIELSHSTISCNVGETIQVTATVYPENATNKNVIWSAPIGGVLLIRGGGVYYANKAGMSNIVATSEDDPDKEAYCFVTVSSVPVSSVTLDREKMTLKEGKSITLTSTVLPANATTKDVTWSSSNSSIASVSSTGVVTAHKKGECNVIVTTNDGGKKAVCAVKVVSSTVDDGSSEIVDFDFWN